MRSGGLDRKRHAHLTEGLEALKNEGSEEDKSFRCLVHNSSIHGTGLQSVSEKSPEDQILFVKESMHVGPALRVVIAP